MSINAEYGCHVLLEENVLRFKVTMYKPCLVEQTQPVQ